VTAITAHQIKVIHAAKGRAGLDEAAYREALGSFGVASSKDLTADQADALISRLNGASKPVQRADRATGPYARKLQALWLTAWNLGVARSFEDSAMLAFVERQTGLSHSRFLIDPKDAAKAIEGLKKWIAREGGVEWPKRRGRQGDLGREVLALKRAVVEAQWRRLIQLGEVTRSPQDVRARVDLIDHLPAYVASKTRGGARRLSSLDDATLTGDELDLAAAHLGRWLRGALVRHAEGGAP
jgi:hypothetical protein